jgi:hypothetical protein
MKFAVVLSVFVGWSANIRSAITYVDATSLNTTLDGAALIAETNYTTGTAEGAMDNLWHLRTSVGNGNGVWTADELATSAEDVAPLVTTISFPETGGYQLFAYVWDSDESGEDWDAEIRVGSSGGFSRIQASEVEPAEPTRFTNAVVTREASRRLMQIPLGVVAVSSNGSTQIFIDDDATTGSRRTWFDGVGYEKIFSTLGERIIAIDCNKTNVAGAPSQAMFRTIGGSSTTAQNKTNVTKLFGPYSIQFSKMSATPFDFRGPNGDTTHLIPGGQTSLPFLVADFIGSRDGTINLSISNLSAGTYFFRSYHLDTFNGVNFGFAQGSSSISQNTLRAHVGGELKAIVQPTALSAPGLNTSFISDPDIPILSFPFAANGSDPVTIQLSTIYTNGVDRFIFLNGFEIFSTAP